MSLLKYWNGSSWATVPDGTAVKYWDGNSWEVPNAVHYWNGSSWVKAWSKSDPSTRTYRPTFTTNLRWDGSQVDYDSNLTGSPDTMATLGLGRYQGEKPYHYVSLLKFDGNSEEGGTNIAGQLAVRPVIKSASLRLYRNTGVGLQYPAGYIRFGRWTQAAAETLPATTLNGTYNNWAYKTVHDIDGWQRGQNRTFSIPPQAVLNMALNDYSIMFSEVEAGYTTSGGTTSAHSQIYGLNNGSPNTSLMPLLTVTFDLA